MTKPYFNWDETSGKALCVIYHGNKCYYGTASCSPEDNDMKSEKVGCEIAFRRANIKYLQGQKNECRTRLEALRHFKSTLSLKIDTNNYIYKQLLKEIKNLEDKIVKYCTKIDVEKSRLREYINDKDDFYKYIRKKRQGKTN